MGLYKKLLIEAENGNRSAIRTIAEDYAKKGNHREAKNWYRKMNEKYKPTQIELDEFGEWCADNSTTDTAEIEYLCERAESEDYDDFINDDEWR